MFPGTCIFFLLEFHFLLMSLISLTVTESSQFQTGREVTGLQKLKQVLGVGSSLDSLWRSSLMKVDANSDFAQLQHCFIFLERMRKKITCTATFRKLLTSSMLLNRLTVLLKIN